MLNKFVATLFSRPPTLPPPDEADWRLALARPIFSGLDNTEHDRLLELATSLIRTKVFSATAGAEPRGEDMAAIALMAALPILHLGASCYAGWTEIVLYPGDFAHEDDEMDENGIVHHMRYERTGEAWAGGPLILSLEAVRASGWCDGYNVVIHEFAHKLDMNNGAVNGFPPLHANVDAQAWAAEFAAAFEDFRARVADLEDETESDIDPYAAENPGEFFAVLSEYFFEWPERVHDTYPAVYEQMCRFYRQDPMQRLNGAVT